MLFINSRFFYAILLAYTGLLPTIVETIIFTILGVLILLFGKELGSILQLLMCLAIIINSIVNILCIYDYKNIRDKVDKRANNKDNKSNMSSAASAVSKAFSEDFHDNNKEFVHAASHIKKKSDATTTAQVTLNIGFK